MGADGFVVDPTELFDAEVRCYICGLTVFFGERPNQTHAGCIGTDGRLAVNVEIDNYEER